MKWRSWAEDEAAGIRAADGWRAPRDFDAAGVEGKLAPDGAPIVSFASNDYLGLSQHPAVIAAAHAALDRWGAGAGAARLIVGSRPVHSDLEVALADWKRCERAVLFATGFAANLAVLATLGGPDVLVCSDELNHASIIDGCRLSRSEIAVYRHGDVEQVAALLATANGRRAIVVTESIFSMDGDLAPIDELAEVCTRHGALLVVDEAHGVLAPPSTLDAHGDDLQALRVGTLSKTLGAFGGFVAGDAELTELLVNRARPYIFTTASTPADSAAALAALHILQSAEGTALRERLRGHVEKLRPGHPSPILPVIIGGEADALAAATRLLEAGMLVPAIRPPTVAPGTSRLRVTLSAAHTDAQVAALARALASL